MRLVVVTASLASVFVLLAVPALKASLCNLRQYRRTRRSAPFAGVDLSEAEVAVLRLPRHWPDPSSLEDAHSALAYWALSVERRANRHLLGETAILVGGAGLGAALPISARTSLGIWACGGALFLAVMGLLLRQYANRYWRLVCTRYQHGYEALLASDRDEQSTDWHTVSGLRRGVDLIARITRVNRLVQSARGGQSSATVVRASRALPGPSQRATRDR